jgi:tubulin delta
MRIISTPEIPEDHLIYTNNNWNSIIKKGYNLLITNTNESKVTWSDNLNVKIKSIVALYRGKNLNDITDELSNYLKGKHLKNSNLNYSLYEKMDINELKNNEKHLTLLSNCNFLSNDLKNTISKAQNMLSNNAFIHQYEKYGMEKSDFLDSIAFCEQINFDYDNY